jgi:predicted nucleotidyltransferase
MGLLRPKPIPDEQAEAIVRAKVAWILKSSSPLAVIVFGSAARGELTEGSDIDIALVFPDEATLKERRAAIYREAPPDAWPADLLFYTEAAFRTKRASGGVCELIAKEGKVVYGGLA